MFIELNSQTFGIAFDSISDSALPSDVYQNMGFDIVVPAAAAMLERSAQMKKRKSELPMAMCADFAVGEPPVDREMLTGIQDILLKSTLIQHQGLLFQSEVTNHPITEDVTAWIGDLSTQMIRYAPKGGTPEVREYFRREAGANYFSSDRQTIVTGGLSAVHEHIDALMTQSRPDASTSIIQIDLASPADFTAAMTAIGEAQRAGNYVKLNITSSSAFTDEQRSDIVKNVQNGRMFVIDHLTEKLDKDRSLGANAEIGDMVISVTNTRLSDITGVHAVFGGEKIARYVQERHTNFKGTPSGSEMALTLKIAEFADDSKYSSLMSLDTRDIGLLPAPEHKFLQNVLHLLQYGAKYVHKADPQAKAEFRRISTSTLKQLEASTTVLLTQYFPYLKDGEEIVIENGGARGDTEIIMDFFAEKKGTRDFIILAPCWPYDNLRKPHYNYKYVDAYTKTGFEMESLKAAMNGLKGKNAVVILPYGPHNPTSYVLTESELSDINDCAADNGVHIIYDPTYSFFTRKDLIDKVKRPIEAESRAKTKGVIHATSFTTSKNLLSPAARVAATITDDAQLLAYVRERRNVEAVNPLATLYLSALTRDPEAFIRLITHANELMERRITIFFKICDRLKYWHGEWRGGYYAMHDSAAEKADPRGLDEMVDEMAAELSLVGDMHASEIFRGVARAALVVPLDVSDKEFEDIVEHLFSAAQRVANKHK